MKMGCGMAHGAPQNIRNAPNESTFRRVETQRNFFSLVPDRLLLTRTLLLFVCITHAAC